MYVSRKSHYEKKTLASQMTLTQKAEDVCYLLQLKPLKAKKVNIYTGNGDGLSSRARNIDDTSSLVVLNNSDRTNAYRICCSCSNWPRRCYHKIRTNPFIGFLGAKL